MDAEAGPFPSLCEREHARPVVGQRKPDIPA